MITRGIQILFNSKKEIGESESCYIKKARERGVRERERGRERKREKEKKQDKIGKKAHFYFREKMDIASTKFFFGIKNMKINIQVQYRDKIMKDK